MPIYLEHCGISREAEGGNRMTAQSKFISGHTRLIGLLGKPIRHSKSPVTHSVSFEKTGINAVYIAFEVVPEDLPPILDAMRVMDGWDGSNVTMPCKQAVISYLDKLTPSAALIGAVNTVQKTPEGKLVGHNTDGLGFMENLRKCDVPVEGAVYTLVGPGGAGSAILVQAALDGVKKINVFARENGPSYNHTKDFMQDVMDKSGAEIVLYPFEDKEAMATAIGESDVLVNATNVGMGEGSTESPVPRDLIKEGMHVADVVYSPLETQLLKDAATKNCKVITGIGMMNEQAAAGEKIWYGIDMPIDEITKEINS